jgi:exonuclease III
VTTRTSEFKFCTWNVDYYNRKGVELQDRIRLVTDLDADAVALQEVRGRDTRHYEIGPSVFSNEFFSGRNTSQWMISGLVFRKGSAILESGLIPMPDREQRSIWARVRLPDLQTPITFVSWHSPHGVGVSAEYKMGGFSAMSEWLAGRSGPVVLGADINTWSDSVDLRPADPEDPYAIEHAFVGHDPEHRLCDAYRMILERDGGLTQLRESTPDGPLAVSHSGTRTRRDRILISGDLTALEAGYDAERGFELSDHAPHWALLEWDERDLELANTNRVGPRG